MTRFPLLLAPLALGLLAAPALTEEPANPQVDYDGFATLTLSLEQYRGERLLLWDEFRAGMQRGDAVLLDTRSAAAFAAGHIEGAVNLPFSDFTQESLLKLLGPDTNRAIYIYCNNNFIDNRPPVTSKKAPLALNIPTFINLYGYGYTNVWELGDLLNTADVPWVEGG